MTEKIAMGDGRVDSEKLLDACSQAAKRFVRADFAQVAADHRSVISAPLFAALAATGALPCAREQFEAAIQRGGVGVESSLAAFRSGFHAVAEKPAVTVKLNTGALLVPLAERIARDFPSASHTILLAGIARLADYQDVAYASEYLDRLAPVIEHDRGELLRETARYLALWMSYEDAIRVADLKTRRGRFEKVTGEARVEPAQLLQIHEFLHPGVQEIADILPAGLGRWLLKSGFARRAVERFAGRRPDSRNHFAARIPAALCAGEPSAVAAQIAALCGGDPEDRRMARAASSRWRGKIMRSPWKSRNARDW